MVQVPPPPPKSQKYDIFDNVYKHFDFPGGEDIDRSSKTINTLLTGRKRIGRGRCVSDYRIWAETVKGEEWICKDMQEVQ